MTLKIIFISIVLSLFLAPVACSQSDVERIRENKRVSGSNPNSYSGSDHDSSSAVTGSDCDSSSADTESDCDRNEWSIERRTPSNGGYRRRLHQFHTA